MNGTGTQTDPYLVATADDFNEIRNTISTTLTYYKQTADIDLSSYSNWVSLSISSSNQINYDGQNFKIIEIDVYINLSTDYTGFIGAFRGEIKNIRIHGISTTSSSSNSVYIISHDVSVSNVKVYGLYANCVGDVSTFYLRTGNISNVHIQGNITSLGGRAAGFVVSGQTSMYANIYDCSFSGNITAINAAGILYYQNADAIISKIKISRCSFKGNITGGGYAIGIAFTSTKSTSQNETEIEDCYVSGLLEGGYAVGIAAYMGKVSTTAKISRCICKANLYAIYYAAGIVISVNFQDLKVGNCYALMNKIVRKSGTSLSFGRIAHTTTYTNLTDNNALDTMEFFDTDDRV